MKTNDRGKVLTVGLLLCVATMLLVASAAIAQECPQSVTGAIFTTDSEGNAVNANIYDDKEDVYLNGGPKKPGTAGLPDGWHYYQVTDPSGKHLLSHGAKRDINARTVLVEDGKFDKIEQLAPFRDSPNSGGVYKVWLTPVGCYGDPKDSATFHGFLPSKSKTDNFKIAGPWKDQLLIVLKFKDCNGNGVWDDDEQGIEWDVTITDPHGGIHEKQTPVVMLAYEGTWTVTESLPWDGCKGWKQTALIVDDIAVVPLAPTTTVTFGAPSRKTEEIHTVVFGNIPLSSIKACKFYDANGDGVRDDGEGPVEGIKFVLTGPSGETWTAYTGADGCVVFCELYPGTYTLTEVLPPNWEPTTPESKEITIECCEEPQEICEEFGNVCFETGTAGFGTKGYWHNKNGLDEITDADIAYVNGLAPYSQPSGYFSKGDEPFDGKFADGTLVAPAYRNNKITDGISAGEGTPRAEISHFLIDPVNDGGQREQLAQQLLAFILNVRNRLPADADIEVSPGVWVPAQDLIDGAIDAWEGSDQSQWGAWASLLDQLNNSSAVPFRSISPVPCKVEYPEE